MHKEMKLTRVSALGLMQTARSEACPPASFDRDQSPVLLLRTRTCRWGRFGC